MLTAVVHKCEVAGKPVKPVVILTDDPEWALLRVVRELGAGELIVGPSGAEAPDERLDRLAGRWREITGEPAVPLTIRLIAPDREERRDLDGGGDAPRSTVDEGTAEALAGVSPD